MTEPQPQRVGLPLLPAMDVPCATAHHANVRDFGAVGDGRKDDTAAFEQAIASLPTRAAAPALSGGIVFVPTGEYRLRRPLRIPERVILMGEHQTAVILRGVRFADPLVTVIGDHARIEHLALHTPGTGLAWQGGRGATAGYLSVRAGARGIVCGADSLGGFSNVDVQASDAAVVGEGCGAVSFFSLATAALVGLSLRSSGPVCVHGLQHLGRGPGLAAADGSRAAIIGGMIEAASSEPGVVCDARSVVHVSSFGSPKRPLAIADAGGETARIARPHVGLYTGQASIIGEVA